VIGQAPGRKAQERPDVGAQFRLFGNVVALCAAAEARRPLVVVVDDLHWTTRPRFSCSPTSPLGPGRPGFRLSRVGRPPMEFRQRRRGVPESEPVRCARAQRQAEPLRHRLQMMTPVMLALNTALHGDLVAARRLFDMVEADAGDDPYAISIWVRSRSPRWLMPSSQMDTPAAASPPSRPS
jgi:hypothetical protein